MTKNIYSCAIGASNGTVHAGSFWKSTPDIEDHGHINGDGVLSDEAIIVKAEEKPLAEDEIEFHDGWSPSHYE